MVRTCLVPLLCASMLMVGCRVDTSPQVVRKCQPGRPVNVENVRFDGEYRLMPAKADDAGFLKPSATSLVARSLVHGQPLGFARDSRGVASAVAGNENIALSGGDTFVWEMRATPGQIDGQKTSALVTGVVVGAGITVFAVICASLPF